MPEAVRIVTLPGGESLPTLVESGRTPVLETTRYAISMLRNAGRAESTIEAHIRAIAMAREWARANGFSLEARMATGAGLDLREIEGLSHALKTAQVPSLEKSSERSNVLPFAPSGREALRRPPRNANPTLAPQTGANRVRFVASYLEWLASHSRAAGAPKPSPRNRRIPERAVEGQHPSNVRAEKGPDTGTARAASRRHRSRFPGEPVHEPGRTPPQSCRGRLSRRIGHAPGRTRRPEDPRHRLQAAHDRNPSTPSGPSRPSQGKAKNQDQRPARFR